MTPLSLKHNYFNRRKKYAIYMYIYIHIYMCISIYIYIYIQIDRQIDSYFQNRQIRRMFDSRRCQNSRGDVGGGSPYIYIDLFWFKSLFVCLFHMVSRFQIFEQIKMLVVFALMRALGLLTPRTCSGCSKHGAQRTLVHAISCF